MSDYLAAHARSDDWKAAAQACVDSLETQGAGTTAGHGLGFVYLTEPFGAFTTAIVESLRAGTGVAHWVGGTATGIVAGNEEVFDTGAISVLLAPIPEERFRVFGTIRRDIDEFASTTGAWCGAHHPHFGVVHGDARNPAIVELTAALAEQAGGAFLVGGLTSVTTSPAQIASGPAEGGLSGVLFDPAVRISTRLTQGCTPLGERHQVTRCEKNIVMELDGRPAFEVFNEDIGELLARDLRRVVGYIFVGFPIQHVDTGDYLVRNLMGIDPRTGVIAVGEHVEEGQSLLFCRRDHAAAVNDLERMLAELRATCDEPPRAGLYHSCLARGPNLFGPSSDELGMIRAAFGNLPLTGFFGNGEISHSRLYTHTGVLTLLW